MKKQMSGSLSCRHPELVSGSRRFESGAIPTHVHNDGIVSARKHFCVGFTLIELLVVVLIIGILAAVALPQYNVAVAKSRLATMVSLMNVLKEAEEVYYLSEGSYTDKMDVLSMDLYSCKQIYLDVVECDNFFMIDPLHNTLPTLRAYYCPDKIKENGSSIGSSAWGKCRDNPELVYTIWLENSSTPNKQECTGRNDFGKKVCKSLHL